MDPIGPLMAWEGCGAAAGKLSSLVVAAALWRTPMFPALCQGHLAVARCVIQFVLSTHTVRVVYLRFPIILEVPPIDSAT